MSYKLHFAPDNASLIIRIFLEEIRAEYSTTLVDRKKNEQKDFDKSAEDLRLATRHLGMIVGKVDVEEILGSIFNDFCIGK